MGDRISSEEIEEPKRWTMQPIFSSIPFSIARTVVVVDPDSMTVALIRHALSGIGYAVSAFYDPQKALAFCESGNVPVALVIIRIPLPGDTTGIALADAIAKRYPATKVILLSHFDKATLLKLEGFGRYSRNHLAVPFTEQTLIKMVRRVDGDEVPTVRNARQSG